MSCLTVDLRHLEIVREVAETGSFTAAARKLHVSQSAVSRQVLLLEEAGLFKKYDLEVPLIFVTAGAPAVATILAGDSEVTQQGAAALSRAFVQGNRDVVFIGGITVAAPLD